MTGADPEREPPRDGAYFVVETLPPVGPFRLIGPEGHHAAAVRRVRSGEMLVLVDGGGGWALGQVVGTDRQHVDLHVAERGRSAQPAVTVTLVQAIGKGDRGEEAVDLATQAGVDRIVPWASTRSLSRWTTDRADRSLGRWRSAAREAAKQSRRVHIPPVEPAADTARVLALSAHAAVALVLHESADLPLARVAFPAVGEVVLVVGPEGGVSDAELAALATVGAQPVRLGREVLRSVTAGAVALGALGVVTGRWDLS